jgi:hypothetical protein
LYLWKITVTVFLNLIKLCNCLNFYQVRILFFWINYNIMAFVHTWLWPPYLLDGIFTTALLQSSSVKKQKIVYSWTSMSRKIKVPIFYPYISFKNLYMSRNYVSIFFLWSVLNKSSTIYHRSVEFLWIFWHIFHEAFFTLFPRHEDDFDQLVWKVKITQLCVLTAFVCFNWYNSHCSSVIWM